MLGGVVSRAERHYRPELDALRFAAFLCVFFFHRMVYYPPDPQAHPWRFRFGVIGVFGVPVFFLLSAYLITELLLRERDNGGRIRIGMFYLRRILRIWPLYFTVLAGLAILTRFVPGVGANDPHAWLAFAGFGGNWYILRHGWIAAPLDPLWSVSVEEQFYLAIPLVAAFGGRRAVTVAACLLLALAYVVILLYPLHPAWSIKGEWPNTLVQAQFFSAGALLAVWLRGRVIRLPWIYRIAGLAATLDCWLVAMGRFHIGVLDREPTACGAALGWSFVLEGAVCLFLSVLGSPPHWYPRGIVYLGRISYGLYMLHSLVFCLLLEKAAPRLLRVTPAAWVPILTTPPLGTMLVLLTSLGMAHLSFRYLEAPFLRLKERLAAPTRMDPQH